jgi:hypothetical protein
MSVCGVTTSLQAAHENLATLVLLKINLGGEPFSVLENNIL